MSCTSTADSATRIQCTEAYGDPLAVFVRVTLARHGTDTVAEFERRVRAIDEIMDCFLMTGHRDDLMRVVSDSLTGYERFVRDVIDATPGIASIDTGFACGVVKRARALPRK